MHPITSVSRHGGVASLAELRNDGVSESSRVASLRRGDIYRVRNGWFCLPSADPGLIAATRVGGRLTCVSLLKSQGLWTMPDDRLHVAVSDNASRLRSPLDRHVRLDLADESIALHWNHYEWAPPLTQATDTIDAAIGHLMRCVPRVSALVTIDSALNHKLITLKRLSVVAARVPGNHQWILKNADATAQSGLETLARCGLRKHQIRVRTQVKINGVGTVDWLIGDRLILELDSRAHHLGDNYEKDRTRDLHALEQGYLVLRVSYKRVMEDWESVERVILSLVRRREHEWRTGQQR